MELYNYINQKREIYDSVLGFIEEENGIDDDYSKLIKIFDSQNIFKNRSEIIETLQIVTCISKNHHRHQYFYKRIEQILDYFSDQMKNNFSNSEIMNIFKNDKKIILYLLEKEILIQDESFVQYIQNNNSFYFYPEIKRNINNFTIHQSILNELDKIDSQDLLDFNVKQKTGENDENICKLIRNDSIIDFIISVNRSNCSLSNQIKPSIFETNSFLVKKETTTLIEYAAFCGAIQIFQYLRMNGVKLTPSLMLYAIHGKNPEIINFLIENEVEKYEKIYEKYFNEAVKCHHNEIANYIKDNFLSDNNDIIYLSPIKYHNYEMISCDCNNLNWLSYACYYNYIGIVELLLNINGYDLNQQTKIKNEIFIEINFE